MAYIEAVFEVSVSVNLYSVLLGKSNVHAERNATYSEEINKLADYLIEMLSSQVVGTSKGTSTW